MLNLRPALLALLFLALHLRSKSVSALPENSGWISHDYGASFQESAILLCEVAAGLQVVLADGVLAVIGGDQNDDHEEGTWAMMEVLNFIVLLSKMVGW
jgi:hypothetical protein